MSAHERTGKQTYSSKISKKLEGHYEDIEFSEEQADQEDWEALERSERADRRQEERYP